MGFSGTVRRLFFAGIKLLLLPTVEFERLGVPGALEDLGSTSELFSSPKFDTHTECILPCSANVYKKNNNMMKTFLIVYQTFKLLQ